MSAAEVPDGFTMGSSGADGGGASSEAAQKQAQRQAILEQVGGCVERCPIQRLCQSAATRPPGDISIEGFISSDVLR